MDSVKDLLNDPLKGTQRAAGVLCYLFRQVLVWRNVNSRVWNRCLDAYFQKPHNAVNPDKGNLNKALKSDDLNWNSFKKAIDFLNPYKATLTIELTWQDDRVSTYVIIVDPTDDEVNPKLNNFPYQHCDVFKNMKKPKSLMTWLFRHIVAEEGYDKKSWDELFKQWAQHPSVKNSQTPEEIANTVNNLRRSVMEDKLSWNVLRRGVLLLAPKKSVYRLQLDWTPDGKRIEPTIVHAIVRDPYVTG